jgi:acylphosphatase
MVRRRAFYHGRVQGVGFRYTARRLAGGFDVAGFVRNLRDGRVELLAEGRDAEVAAFLDAIRSELGDKILGVELLDEPAGEPPVLGFEIRH